MSSIEEDIEINTGSLHYILGKMTADIEGVQAGLNRLDNRMWGTWILLLAGMGMQIMFEVMS